MQLTFLGFVLSTKLGNHYLTMKVEQIEGDDIYDIVKRQQMKINQNIRTNSDFPVQKFTTYIKIGRRSLVADCIANEEADKSAYFILFTLATRSIS